MRESTHNCLSISTLPGGRQATMAILFFGLLVFRTTAATAQSQQVADVQVIVAAVQHIRSMLPAGPILLDSASMNFPESLAANSALVESFGFRVAAQADTPVDCPTDGKDDPCTFDGAAAFLMVGVPNITGNRATIQVGWYHDPTPVQVPYTRHLLLLERVRGKWVVTKVLETERS